MDDKSKIIEKICKLLALGKSSNPNESAIAMSRAQKLMQQHEISQEDIDLAAISQADRDVDFVKFNTYQILLMNLICSVFGCKPVVSTYWQSSTIHFIGVSPRPELAAYCWEVTFPALIKARAEHVKSLSNRCKRSTKIARGDSFAEYWVYGVSGKVNRLSIDENTDALIEEYKQTRIGNLTTTKGRDRTTTAKNSSLSDSKMQGFKEGNKQRLDTPINGTETAKLGAA